MTNLGSYRPWINHERANKRSPDVYNHNGPPNCKGFAFDSFFFLLIDFIYKRNKSWPMDRAISVKDVLVYAI